MARLLTAAAFVALLSVELSAQPVPHGHLTIQTDVACEEAPRGARVEVDPSSSNPRPVQETDGQGRIQLDLPAGTHTVSITSGGLNQWTRQIEIQAGENPPLIATLSRSDGTIIDCVMVPTDIVFPLSPEPIFLSPQPLLNLDPLPTRPAKRHK